MPRSLPRLISIKALAFLLGYCILAALLNYLNSLSIPQSAPAWVQVIGAGISFLYYVPVYWVFIHSLHYWKWSLDEWGFGLKGRNWLAIGLSAFVLLIVWLPLPAIQIGSARLLDLGSLRETTSRASVPQMIFEGYARTAEELLFRGFALVLFKRMFSNSRVNWLWAILFSSALFALVHTHRPDQMLTLFLEAAIPLAAFTLLTRSISFAFVIHGIAGGGPVGGLVAMLFFLIIAVVDALTKRPSFPDAVNSNSEVSLSVPPDQGSTS